MVNLKRMYAGVLLVALCMVLCSCSEVSTPSEKSLQMRCSEIAELYRDIYDNAPKQEPKSRWDERLLSQDDIDAIEVCLENAGLDILDSSGDCPSYFVNAERFHAFWDAVQRNESASQEIIGVRPSGALSYRLLTHQNGTTCVYRLTWSLETNAASDYEVHQVYGAELTERENFFYRVNPKDDPHYANYALIRLKKPNQELWNLYNRYVLAGGYTAANLFLTDWTENDFSGLCFNDLWEYLYRYREGTQFWPDGYPYDRSRMCFFIPEEEFESAVLPFFDLDAEALREYAQYDERMGGYPWHQVTSNDYTFYLSYYTIEPEVTASRTNPDGTVTLTVEALSTDLGIDCLFSHEVTVRPLDSGGFQFVGNRVLTQTERGLPYCKPRLTWNYAC